MEFAPQYLISCFQCILYKVSSEIIYRRVFYTNNEQCGGLFPWIFQWDDFFHGCWCILLLPYLMLDFQIKYLWTNIVHIIMNNTVVVLLKSSKYKAFYRDFYEPLILEYNFIRRFFSGC